MKLCNVLMAIGLAEALLAVMLFAYDLLPDQLGWVLIGSMYTLIILAVVFEYTDWQLASKESGNG